MLLLALVSVVAGDQASKALVLAGVGEGRALVLGPRVRVRPIRNRGSVATALGLRPVHLLPLWLVILLAAVLLPARAGLFDTAISRTALGIALGGAVSNLLDHGLRGGVVDFIDVWRWPAFNLADAAIVSGVILALVAS
jgi:signal peptidase II